MKIHNKIKYNDKIVLLRKLKHNIKKRRLVFDEERTNFKLDRLEQLSRIKNTSEVKGYPCVGFSADIEENYKTKLGLKINPLESKYNKVEHPSNLECIILKKLTEELIDNNICPHIVYYLDQKKVSNRCKALKFISNSLRELERDDVIKNYSNVLFSEYIEGGCLDKWIKNCYDEITVEEWKYIAFSLLYTLYILQEKYKIIHNDVHYGNILIDNTIEAKGYIVYEFKVDGKDYKYYFKNFGFIPKIWDFEFAMCYDNTIKDLYPNKFIIKENSVHKDLELLKISEDSKYYDKYKNNKNESSFTSSDILCTPYNYNEYYDVHYLLTSFLDLYIPDELLEWIVRLFPKELIPNINSDDYSNSSSFETEIDSYITDSESKTTETYSESEIETDSESSEEYYSESDYMYKGRLINGVEKIFKLPTPKNLLLHSFFDEFLEKPQDFDENECLFFKFN